MKHVLFGLKKNCWRQLCGSEGAVDIKSWSTFGSFSTSRTRRWSVISEPLGHEKTTHGAVRR
jgi:hypothetical protein